MYKHSFTLLQHSPLVHHLGIEGWSGLQVKAVSPMLNTFIAEKISGIRGIKSKTEFIKQFKNSCIHISEKNWNAGCCNSCEIIDCKFKGWFRNKKEVDSLAFNYDLDFKCEVDKEASYSQKIINQAHAHILYKERKISASIICTSASLKERIISSLTEFFVLTGFGYRSSKGYGGFTLEETTEDKYKGILNNYYNAHNQTVFCHNTNRNLKRLLLSKIIRASRRINDQLDFRKSDLSEEMVFDSYKIMSEISMLKLSSGDVHKIPDNVLRSINLGNIYHILIQEVITEHWKWIKSGTNFPYYKSLLWMYFCGQYGNETGWEKRFIKESLKENHNSLFSALKKNDREGQMRYETNDQPIDYQFYRTLLGLAEHYEFALRDGYRIDNKASININVKSESLDIERIPSPVKFKVFGDSIYLIVDSVDENIQDAVFKFMYKQDELKFGDIDRLSIHIPANGLKDCFNKILLETAELEHRHPLCEQYNIL